MTVQATEVHSYYTQAGRAVVSDSDEKSNDMTISGNRQHTDPADDDDGD